MSKNLKTEAGVNLPNHLLQLIDYFGFSEYSGNRVYTLDVDNGSNCQSRIFLHLLNDDETIRVSVGDFDTGLLDNPIDMFETKEYEKIESFVNLVR